MKANMFASHKQHSFALILPGNPKKTHTDQLYYKFFHPL